MSGRGGGGEGPTEGRARCESLVFEATLQSVQSDAAKAIRTGDYLDVVAQQAAGPIVARHPKHGVVGSLISRVPDLLRCLQQGVRYRAEVLSIDIPAIIVRVAPR